jgi:hypothetical protein
MSSKKGIGCKKYDTLPFEKINKNFYMVNAGLSIEIEVDKLPKRFQNPLDGPVRFETGFGRSSMPHIETFALLQGARISIIFFILSTLIISDNPGLVIERLLGAVLLKCLFYRRSDSKERPNGWK